MPNLTPTTSPRPEALCSVLVPSCDAYSDLWEPFFHCFARFWPDCPFDVYLGCNEMNPQIPGARPQPAGHGAQWAARVREQIEGLTSPYVLLMLEDFLLRRRVDTGALVRCWRSWLPLDAHCLRLVTRPGPNAPIAGQPLFGALAPDAPYRVSTQAAIWRRETLLSLMRSGETIWQFELAGSVRSRSIGGGFFGVWRSMLPYDHHVVERGKWFRHAVRWCRRKGVPCDTARRPMMTRAEDWEWKLRKARGVAADWLPYRARRRVRSLLGRQPV